MLDLGSGPGLDALLAASLVGPGGRVIGVDMTPEMLAGFLRDSRVLREADALAEAGHDVVLVARAAAGAAPPQPAEERREHELRRP